MEENKQNRTVGISGLKMDNSSITSTTIVGGNSDANVGIFDTEMKDTHLSDLKIEDKKKQETVHRISPERKSSLQKFFFNPYVLLFIGIAIEEITLGKIYKNITSFF